MCSNAAGRTLTVRELDVHAAVALLHCIGISMFLRSPVMYIGDRGRLLSTLPARRGWRWGPFFRR